VPFLALVRAAPIGLLFASEAVNKRFGTRICVSATLAATVKDFRGRPAGDLLLRGRSEAIRAVEPLRAEQYEDPSTNSYLEAFAKLEASDPGAIAAFAAHQTRRAARGAFRPDHRRPRGREGAEWPSAHRWALRDHDSPLLA
jgi:hypothetical protein